MPTEPAIAIVGATGAVGEELLALLAERSFPARSVRVFASARSAGKTLRALGRDVTVEPLAPGCFAGTNIAFFSASSAISKEWAPQAVASGAWVIDKSSAFRMDQRYTLAIPEVNGAELDALRAPTIIAVPNCSTIIALMAVSPLHREAGIARMVVSTYQAASGAGAAAMAELAQQAGDWSAGQPLQTPIFGRQYIFNLFSHDSAIGADGQNEEERKLLEETRKIWRDPDVAITATCVRVPVLRAHSESINLTFRTPITEERARAVLAAAPGIELVDDRAANRFPEPINATGRDAVLVGRIRADHSQAAGFGLNLFVSGDQIRKGAALNGLQIAERLLSV
ncbi:MAG TPA: aspartate-semialdehyde dehydrogenase [Phycisphaerales bacterium]|nr:aspartate-semialdehyde dehydrogenase [Phycisphaerales bacterium]